MQDVLPENDQQVTELIDAGKFKRLKESLDDERVRSVLLKSKNNLLVLLNAVAREQHDDFSNAVSNLKVIPF